MSDGRDDTQARPAGGVRPSPDLLQKWSHAPYWGPDEGVALAFGLDPARVIKSDIAGYHAPYLSARGPAPHFADFAHRALAMGHLEYRAHPSDFIDWAKTVGLAFHDDWTSALPPRTPAGPGAAVGSAALAAPRPPSAPGRRNLGVVAAKVYRRVFPDGHAELDHSWESALDEIAKHGAPEVSKRTLRRGLETLRQKEI